MSDLAREFQYAWRRLRRAPAFTVTSLVVLGIGLGATTTMFSIVNAVLLRPLPFPNSTQLVAVAHTATISGLQQLQALGRARSCCISGTTRCSTTSESRERRMSA